MRSRINVHSLPVFPRRAPGREPIVHYPFARPVLQRSTPPASPLGDHFIGPPLPQSEPAAKPFNPVLFFNSTLIFARSLGVSSILIPREVAEKHPEILVLPRSERIGWIEREGHEYQNAIGEQDFSVVLPEHSSNPLSQTKMAFFKSLMDGKVSPKEQVLCLGGAMGDDASQGIFSVMSAGKNFPWIPEEGEMPLKGHRAREIFQSVLNLALRFAQEGGDGKKIATTFIIGTTEQLKGLGTEDTINFLPNNKKNLMRRIQDDASVDAIRGLSQIRKSFFLVNTRGGVEAMLKGLQGNAKDVTVNSELLSIEVTEEGDVRAYSGGKNILDFEKRGREGGRIEPEVMVQSILNFSRMLGIDQVMLPAPVVKDNASFQALERSERVGWLGADVEESRHLMQRQDYQVGVSSVPLSRLSFLSYAFFRAYLEGKISETSEVLVTAGMGGLNSIDTVSVLSLKKLFPWVNLADGLPIKEFRGKDVLMAALESALKIVGEKKGLDKVGTILVVGDSESIASHVKPLNEFPMGDIRSSLRQVTNVEFIADLAQMDGAIMINLEGQIEAACQRLEPPKSSEFALVSGLGTRHESASAYTAATNTAAVVISDTGMIRVFYRGRVLLELAKPSPMAPSGRR